jgi:CRP-like cAMP-binding protein|uniref:cAMP-binding proteins-catabolite gene activator and regulatory subunit of cAMP-dependent protein kinases n=1 Tax=uncultured myxobacterium HF0130_06F04 TaxID=723555 RepID=E7C2E3_9BACT|nr:cAMP-binding proteins - catabolite gene activator and regulatory subunit of cAMP-dependent protein kinases [uncultured myxobacterium HF0130_06F04]
METEEKRAILAESPLFDNLLTTELTMLADLFTFRTYSAGELIFDEGNVGDSMYVIAEGSVEVLRKNPQGELLPIAVLQAPQFFGEMSLIDKEYRSATVRANDGAKLLQLSNENLHIFARNYRNGFTWVVVNIARVLSTRLREVNRRLAEKL